MTQQLAEFEVNPDSALAVQPKNIIEAVQQRIVSGDLPIEVLERLLALRDKELARQAEIEFNDALTRVQGKVKRIAPDLDNPQTRSKYASYAAIDRVIRPIYTDEGFSLSFSEEDCPKPDHIRVACYCSRAGHTRIYRKDMAADGKGAKGGDVMTKTHAEAAADSYAKRYLVKNIFNVAIGEDDNDGNLTNGWLSEHISKLSECIDQQSLTELFTAAYKEAKQQKNATAVLALIEARDKRRAELG